MSFFARRRRTAMQAQKRSPLMEAFAPAQPMEQPLPVNPKMPRETSRQGLGVAAPPVDTSGQGLPGGGNYGIQPVNPALVPSKKKLLMDSAH